MGNPAQGRENGKEGDEEIRALGEALSEGLKKGNHIGLLDIARQGIQKGEACLQLVTFRRGED